MLLYTGLCGEIIVSWTTVLLGAKLAVAGDARTNEVPELGHSSTY